MRKLYTLLAYLVLSGCSLAVELPKPRGWVNDFAEVISSDYEQKLTSLITELEQKTSAEIAVVTMTSISPYDEAGYARLLFDNWKPGKKGKDNGVVVLLAIKERAWRIDTGYGLEGVLPDGRCGEIGRDYMVPHFKRGKYGEGLYYGVAAIAKAIAEDARVEMPGLRAVKLRKPREAVPIPLYLFCPLFLLVWGLPWPLVIGVPFVLIFAVGASFAASPALGAAMVMGYLGSLALRYRSWSKTPRRGRWSFWGTWPLGQSSGGHGGGWGGGGGGFGGFGGGGGGGGGAGGHF